jgi:hypothetical protein
MSETVNNFDVLKRMSADNKSIMLCPDVLNMTYSKKVDGTQVTIGVPGNPIAALLQGEKNAVMLIWDVKEFNEVKAQIMAEREEKTA